MRQALTRAARLGQPICDIAEAIKVLCTQHISSIVLEATGTAE